MTTTVEFPPWRVDWTCPHCQTTLFLWSPCRDLRTLNNTGALGPLQDTARHHFDNCPSRP